MRATRQHDVDRRSGGPGRHPAAVCCVLAAFMLAAASPGDAAALELELRGYVDGRLVAAPDEPGWADGGLGKLRWGDDGGLRSGGAALLAVARITPELLGLATLQYQTTDRSGAEVLEAWLRWRPVSITPWRWSLRAGAFFPTVSLENGAVGWTSPYTLTPSAINSWVGEELRSIGAELRFEHRGARSSFEAALAVFGGNDPAGEQMAVRGWSLSDRAYGIGGSLRTPDLSARTAPPPRRFDPFVEMDDRIGWHGELAWDSAHFGRLKLMRYDNRADPTESLLFEGHRVFAWRTDFWSLGTEQQLGGLVLVAQGMVGNTRIEPSRFFRSETAFWSGFLLLAAGQGEWRPAVRVDYFGTSQDPDPPGFEASEHGRALTLALNWRPRDWLRVTGELITIESARTDRPLAGIDQRITDTQLQLGLRILF